MAITLYNNKFLNRIPFENPWISSLIASLIGISSSGYSGIHLPPLQREITRCFIHNLPAHGIHRLRRNIRYMLCSMHTGIFITTLVALSIKANM
jgi:hypothetical protein